MVLLPLRDELGADSPAFSARTLPQWPVPLAVAGVLMLAAATVPMVHGQRGFGVTGDTSPYKGYSGVRVQVNAKRLVYFHEQTIAVVELGENRELYNCELIEVYKPAELKIALRNMSDFAKPFRLNFEEMMELMTLCDMLGPPPKPGVEARALPPVVNPLTLLNGILPGTKWCGAGDLANNYFDLGLEADIDRCCRAHDLCPVKVRSQTTRYNLTNNSIYTKSHCTCDDILLHCLKSTNRQTADLMGNIYFNLLKVPCMRQGRDRSVFVSASRY